MREGGREGERDEKEVRNLGEHLDQQYIPYSGKIKFSDLEIFEISPN